jgi:succinyl-diaminopimelate desuccinylase
MNKPVDPQAGDPRLDTQDLVELTRALVAVPSVSRGEGELADLIEARLARRAPHLKIYRTGNNLVARTERGAPERIVFAGHIDTVPLPADDYPAQGPDCVTGLGAVDMKGGIAVMLLLAEDSADSVADATFVFYDKEEIGSHNSGLGPLFAEHYELVAGDFAVVLEPTDCVLEAGCQGNLVMEFEFRGTAAHSARPWMGRNAIHLAAPALTRLAGYTPEPAEAGGLVYRQAFGVVGAAGGRQGNVVPDRCTVKVNYRHAPGVTTEAAIETVRAMVPETDQVRVLLKSPPGEPRQDHPIFTRLAEHNDLPVRPKLGWTDVARFAQRGIAAINFGPGDPELAHSPGEIVSRDSLERCHDSLRRLIGAAGTGLAAHGGGQEANAVTQTPVNGPLTERYLAELASRRPAIGELIAAACADEHLKVAYGERYLARPALLEADRMQGLEADLSRLHALLASLPGRLFGGDLAAYGRAVGMTGVQVTAALRTTAGHPVHLGRADLYQDPGGYRLLEFNIGSPLGGFDVAVLNRAMLASPVLADFVREQRLGYVDTLARIADLIKAECETLGTGSRPVVLLTDTPGNFSIMAARLRFVAGIWAGMGLDTVACGLEEVEWRSGRCFARGRAVDLIYRFFLTEDLLNPDDSELIEPVIAAAERGTVGLLSRMDAELFGNKAALAMLSQHAHSGAFSAGETAFIDRFLPWSAPLRDGDGEMFSYAAAHQVDLVLKPTLLHGGIGVIPGWTVSAQEWGERVRAAAGGPYILQRRVRPVRESFPAPAGPPATEDLALNWGVFLVQDRYAGTIVRGSRDPQVGVVSMAGGAMVGCCFHQLPRATTGSPTTGSATTSEGA